LQFLFTAKLRILYYFRSLKFSNLSIMKQLIFFSLIMFLANTPLYPQSVKAVLVQINSEQNRIGYLQKSGKNKEAENVTREAIAMTKIMVSDFNDNFVYCPVYYFVDTNIQQIKKQNFKGVLLNANGTIVENSILDPNDSDYVIITYGFPDENTSIRQTKGLVIYTDKFTQSYFFSKPDQYDVRRKYRYRSDKYDIEYYPSAKQLDLYLRKMNSN